MVIGIGNILYRINEFSGWIYSNMIYIIILIYI